MELGETAATEKNQPSDSNEAALPSGSLERGPDTGSIPRARSVDDARSGPLTGPHAQTGPSEPTDAMIEGHSGPEQEAAKNEEPQAPVGEAKEKQTAYDLDPDVWAARLADVEGSAGNRASQRMRAPGMRFGVMVGGAVGIILGLALIFWLISLVLG